MACGCGNSVCACKIQGGSNVTVTGVGSTGNPYVISSSGGGGGPSVVMTTIAGVQAAQTGGTLAMGTTYVVTDWVSGAGSLPGPNVLVATPTSPSTMSGFVQVKTPLGALGPSDGEFFWTGGLMTRLRDPLGNDIQDLGTGLIDSFVWGNATWTNNQIDALTLSGGFTASNAAATAGLAIAGNKVVGCTATIDLTGCTGGSISSNLLAGGALSLTTGANPAALIDTQVLGGGLTMPAGSSVTFSRFSAGCAINLGAFAHASVVVDGAYTQTLTANNSNTYRGFGANTLV